MLECFGRPYKVSVPCAEQLEIELVACGNLQWGYQAMY